MNILSPEYNTLTRGDIDMSALHAFGELTILEHPSEEELKTALKTADVLLVNKIQVTEELLAGADRLRYVGECATGFNNIDVAACKARGITVTNVPTYSTGAVAQMVFAYLLEHFSKVHDYNALVQDGGWVSAPTFSRFDYDCEELEGKTLGLVGYGKIGSTVASIGAAFGMKVLATSRNRTAGSDGTAEFVPLDELLARSDVVSVHCPLTPETQGLFRAETFAKMKDGAFFINTSRGPVVAEEDLRDALVSGKLSGAALDVLTAEPMAKDCPLLGLPNCIITPHVAWAPKDTRQRLVIIVAANLKAFLDGAPINTV